MCDECYIMSNCVQKECLEEQRKNLEQDKCSLCSINNGGVCLYEDVGCAYVCGATGFCLLGYTLQEFFKFCKKD